MVGRISTYVFSNRINAENLRLQIRASEAQLSMSGKKGSSYSVIGRDTLRLLNVQNDLARTETQNIVASNVASRVQTMYSSIQNMIDLGNQFRQTMAASLSGNLAVPAEVQNVASNSEQALASLMNINFGGRYLFAGDLINTPPVDLTDPGYTAQGYPSVPNFNYYQGDQGIAQAEVSDGFSVSYGVTGDNPAFEQLFRAMNLASNNAANAAARQEAFDLATTALAGLAAIQTDLSSNATLVDQQKASNEDDTILFKSVVADISETDIAQASVNLTQYQTQLEASYATVTRAIRLKLFNYL
ncbi:MAG: hypothetical protein AB7E85_08280 [Pseudobdellovibrionaceae bacterium]